MQRGTQVGCRGEGGAYPCFRVHARSSVRSTVSLWCPWRLSAWSLWSLGSAVSAVMVSSAPAGVGRGVAGGAGAARGAHWPGPGPHLCTRPQCHLPAVSLPEAGPAHPPQGLPGAAAGPWPPAGSVAGPHPRRTPVGAPASAPHCRGPGCGAHAAAPPPGEGPGQEGRGCGQGRDSRPPALPGSPPLHLLPKPLLPCRVPWSSALTCPPWAATPSCCTASSPTTPPSLWRSSSAGAESGKVSGRGGPGGGPPGEKPIRGLLTQPCSVVVVTDMDRSVLS